MKKGLKKFAKGMFAIFTIKLLFFGTIFIIQSCNEDYENREIGIAENNFIDSLLQSKNNFVNIGTPKKSSINENFFSKNTNEEYAELILVKTDPNKSIEIENFNQVVESIYNGEVELGSEKIICKEDETLCVSISKTETKNALLPAINSAKDYLYSSGFNDFDIIEILNGEDDSTLIPIVQLIIS